MEKLIAAVDRAYKDCDEQRALLENILTTSSKELQELYRQLKERSESELATSEAKYRRLIENLQPHYFFYTLERDGSLSYLSESVTAMLGYTKEEFLTHCSKYLTDHPLNKKVDEHIHNAFGGIKQPPFEVGIYHKDGSVRFLEIIMLPLLNDGGAVDVVEGIAKDVTYQHEAQEKNSLSGET